MTFFGDGATNIGTFHESLNMAAAWKVGDRLHHREQPLRRVHAAARSTPIDDLAERAKAHAMPGVIVDGQDVDTVHAAANEAVARARAGEGPTLLEMKTYRFRGHSRTDPAKYRPEGELARWQKRDPITILGARLAESGDLSEEGQSALREEIQQLVDETADRAQAGAAPDVRGDSRAMSTQVEAVQPPDGDAVEMTCREAVNAALVDEMSSDPTVYMLGEDVANEGGVFKTNDGLPEQFPGRVVNTPICENTFIGLAIGMSVTGLRPVVEIMFCDFLPTAADAIIEELPKFRFMTGGQCSLPVTVRSIGGGTGRFGTQHSATGESWFMGFPGLIVATAGTAGGRLRRAARGDPGARTPCCSSSTRASTGARARSRRGEDQIAEIGQGGRRARRAPT